MRAISVTICRDRQPDSLIAPLAPLPADEWQRFRLGVLAAMERHVPSDEETERHQGRTVWDGREEECEIYSRIWADPSPEQLAALRAELAELARRYDQAAVVLHDEVRHLVTAA